MIATLSTTWIASEERVTVWLNAIVSALGLVKALASRLQDCWIEFATGLVRVIWMPSSESEALTQVLRECHRSKMTFGRLRFSEPQYCRL